MNSGVLEKKKFLRSLHPPGLQVRKHQKSIWMKKRQPVSSKLCSGFWKRDWKGVSRFLKAYAGQPVLIFGCIYLECGCGHLHVSTYSDLIIRDMEDFSECPVGKEGVIQVLSPMAASYPGHSILTEDQGILLGIDDCPCERKGKYFKITERIPKTEIRGCSDVYG